MTLIGQTIPVPKCKVYRLQLPIIIELSFKLNMFFSMVLIIKENCYEGIADGLKKIIAPFINLTLINVTQTSTNVTQAMDLASDIFLTQSYNNQW